MHTASQPSNTVQPWLILFCTSWYDVPRPVGMLSSSAFCSGNTHICQPNCARCWLISRLIVRCTLSVMSAERSMVLDNSPRASGYTPCSHSTSRSPPYFTAQRRPTGLPRKNRPTSCQELMLVGSYPPNTATSPLLDIATK